MRLEGKVAVVTGAGSGMGRATALLFVREGAMVVGGDINAARLDAVVDEAIAASGRMIGVAGDVSKREDAEALVQRAIDEFGTLDILVNNAGIMDMMEGVGNFKDDTFDRVFGVNVYGPFVTSRAAVRHMKESGGGAIVNVSSVAGVTGASAGAVYTASKHAITGLTKSTSLDGRVIDVETGEVMHPVELRGRKQDLYQLLVDFAGDITEGVALPPLEVALVQERRTRAIPPEAVTLFSRAQVLEDGGRRDQAIELYRQIEERFPIDGDLRSHIFEYGRGVFDALRIHVAVKRGAQAAAFVPVITEV